MQCYQGTPVFIARAVQLGRAVPLEDISKIPAVPHSPTPYTTHHPERIKKFRFEKAKAIEAQEAPVHSDSCQWRHELDHDVESVFWLIVYWVMGAQPVECSKEVLDHAPWSFLTSNVKTRGLFIRGMANDLANITTHSFYEGVHPLLRRLAAILVVDRVWLEKTDARNDPGYTCEAFQRLILQFILDNRHKEFMWREVEPLRREVEPLPRVPSLTETTGQRRYAGSVGKRKRSPSVET